MRDGLSLPFLDDPILDLTADTVRVTGRLKRADSIYAGHFPGRPILPAIAQLELLRATLSAALGTSVALVEVAVLKLRQTLIPGQELKLEIGFEGERGARRFTLLAAGSAASSGSFRVADAEWPWKEMASTIPDAIPQDAQDGDGRLTSLPHTPPARLVHRIDTWDDEEIRCSGSVPSGHALVKDGLAPSFLGLEAAAQAAGLLESFQRGAGVVEPSIGYIVGMKDVTLDSTPLAAGLTFRVVARRTGGAGSLVVYTVEASGAATSPFARGTLSAFLPAAPSLITE